MAYGLLYCTVKDISQGNTVLDQLKEKVSSRIEARGIIVPSQWDNTGNITTLSFLTDDEREFHIESWNDIITDFTEYDKRPVMISGIQRREGSETPIIIVSRLEILDSSDQ